MPIQNHHNQYQSSTNNTILLVITAVYIATLCVMNLLNITRFISFDMSIGNLNLPFSLPIGMLPYPLTFLCTDVVAECYGKKAANRLVTAGLIANIWMLGLLWALGWIQAPNPDLIVSKDDPNYAFYFLRLLSMTAIISSMLAYLIAQYLDVFLFHALKKLTQDKHLWLRNNVSTMVSQLVDTIIVLTCTYFMTKHVVWDQPNSPAASIQIIILTSYLFKCVMALLDTLPCYFFVWLIKRQQIPKHVSMD